MAFSQGWRVKRACEIAAQGRTTHTHLLPTRLVASETGVSQRKKKGDTAVMGPMCA